MITEDDKVIVLDAVKEFTTNHGSGGVRAFATKYGGNHSTVADLIHYCKTNEPRTSSLKTLEQLVIRIKKIKLGIGSKTIQDYQEYTKRNFLILMLSKKLTQDYGVNESNSLMIIEEVFHDIEKHTGLKIE